MGLNYDYCYKANIDQDQQDKNFIIYFYQQNFKLKIGILFLTIYNIW